jgi:transposase
MHPEVKVSVSVAPYFMQCLFHGSEVEVCTAYITVDGKDCFVRLFFETEHCFGIGETMLLPFVRYSKHNRRYISILRHYNGNAIIYASAFANLPKSPIMAKDSEKKVARILYVEQGKTAKEISALINVSEVTISKWVNGSAWKTERTARNVSTTSRIANIRDIINSLSETRIEQIRHLKEAEANADAKECDELRNQIAQTDDAVSKWNKTLMTLDKENSISLSTYIQVMQQIFAAMQQFDAKMFLSTVDFQDVHLNDISTRFK